MARVRRHPRRRADERLCARRRGRVRAALRAPSGGPVPLHPPPARHRARGADRRGVPGHLAEGRACARALGAAGRDLSHLALHARPSPGDRPAAQERPRGRRSTRSRTRAASPGSPTRRPGSTGPRPPAPRRRARTWRSGGAPARSCCSASSSCRWRSAAPSCSITTTASPSTRSRARSRSASRPRRRGCATR